MRKNAEKIKKQKRKNTIGCYRNCHIIQHNIYVENIMRKTHTDSYLDYIINCRKYTENTQIYTVWQQLEYWVAFRWEFRQEFKWLAVELDLFWTSLFLELKHTFFKLLAVIHVLAKPKSQPADVDPIRMFYILHYPVVFMLLPPKISGNMHYIYGSYVRLAVRPSVRPSVNT